MKRIIGISLFITLAFSVIPIIVFASSVDKKEEVTIITTCDKGATNYYFYRLPTKYVVEIINAKEQSLYRIHTPISAYVPEEIGIQYLYRAAGSNKIIQFSNVWEWLFKIKELSPNLYHFAFDLGKRIASDCEVKSKVEY